jgi:hypothetical protein
MAPISARQSALKAIRDLERAMYEAVEPKCDPFQSVSRQREFAAGLGASIQLGELIKEIQRLGDFVAQERLARRVWPLIAAIAEYQRATIKAELPAELAKRDAVEKGRRIAPAHHARRQKSQTIQAVIDRHASNYRSQPGHGNRTCEKVATDIQEKVNSDLDSMKFSLLKVDAIAKRLRGPTDDHASDDISDA